MKRYMKNVRLCMLAFFSSSSILLLVHTPLIVLRYNEHDRYMHGVSNRTKKTKNIMFITKNEGASVSNTSSTLVSQSIASNPLREKYYSKLTTCLDIKLMITPLVATIESFNHELMYTRLVLFFNGRNVPFFKGVDM